MLSLQPRAQAPEPVLIDRVVVVVSDRIITASDITLEAELARRIPSPVRALRDIQLRDPTQALIEQSIIRSYAAQVAIYQPTAEEVQQRLRELRETFPSPDDYDLFLSRHGLSEVRIIDRLRSRLSVERYVHRNIDLSSQSAREDEEAYFRRYRDWISAQLTATTVRFVEPS
jgi:hypothetical protein